MDALLRTQRSSYLRCGLVLCLPVMRSRMEIEEEVKMSTLERFVKRNNKETQIEERDGIDTKTCTPSGALVRLFRTL